jgi:hypothetical protein
MMVYTLKGGGDGDDDDGFFVDVMSKCGRFT